MASFRVFLAPGIETEVFGGIYAGYGSVWGSHGMSENISSALKRGLGVLRPTKQGGTDSGVGPAPGAAG